MSLHKTVLSLVSGFFAGNPSIPSNVPSNVDQRKFNELVEFPSKLADYPPPQELVDVLTPEFLQHLVQAAAVAGAHIVAAQLLSIPGNQLPNDWKAPIIPEDSAFTHEVLPDRSGMRVTHAASGLSAVSTSENSLHEDHLKALKKLKAIVGLNSPPPVDTRIGRVEKIIKDVFKKHGCPNDSDEMNVIQQKLAKLLNELDLKVEVSCILMPPGRDPNEWSSMLKDFTSAQMKELKRLTDAGDQAAIEKFFTAAQAAKKAG